LPPHTPAACTRELSLSLIRVPRSERLDCRADLPLLHERVAARQARRDDASEADIAVLERLHDECETLGAEERAQAIVADAAQPPDITAIAAAWLTRR
jgi:predicted kinase